METDHAVVRLAILAGLILVCMNIGAWAASKMITLHNFGAGQDGAGPHAALVLDAAGNLYGTTSWDSVNESGTVFELIPLGGGDWKERILYRFAGGADGREPESSLVLDSSGNLYGTTYAGGAFYGGTVFKLSPSPSGWQKTTIYDFGSHANDGFAPHAPLIFDAAGNLYGTTMLGGSGGDYLGAGTAFQLVPPVGAGSWTENIICDFDTGSCPSGMEPWSGLTLGQNGNLFGTTRLGGNSANCHNGCGTVYKLVRVGDTWKQKLLYRFDGGGNAGWPKGGVVLDAQGTVYGTASEGGEGSGIVFQLKYVKGQWKERVIYNLCTRRRCSDGAQPWAGVAIDQSGNLYGTTLHGGDYGRGTVFKLTPTDKGWVESVLASFGGSEGPLAPVILDQQGNVYGTTAAGGKVDGGTAFEITP